MDKEKKEHIKLDVALELLNVALSMHYSEATPYSALHLATAAEEVLGAYVKINKEQTSFSSLCDGALKALGHTTPSKERKNDLHDIEKLLNHEKNNVKHGHGIFIADIRLATSDALTRAIDNYDTLCRYYELDESELIRTHREYCYGVGFINDEEE